MDFKRFWEVLKYDFSPLSLLGWVYKYIVNDVLIFMLKALWIAILIKFVLIAR